jgi:hypothetical protein
MRPRPPIEAAARPRHTTAPGRGPLADWTGDARVFVPQGYEPGYDVPDDLFAAEADDAEIADVLAAPPRRAIDRRYTVEEIEGSPDARDAVANQPAAPVRRSAERPAYWCSTLPMARKAGNGCTPGWTIPIGNTSR